jgi:hypothetical protein
MKSSLKFGDSEHAHQMNKLDPEYNNHSGLVQAHCLVQKEFLTLLYSDRQKIVYASLEYKLDSYRMMRQELWL